MKIELTQKELIKIVRKHYGIEANVDLEVTVAEPVKPAQVKLAPKKKDDSKDLLEDVKAKQKAKKKKTGSKRKEYHFTAPGTAEIDVPKNPKIDYKIYGDRLKRFVESDEGFIVPYEEGVRPTALAGRYRIASQIYGYRSVVRINYSRSRKVLIISKPGCAPKQYVPTEHLKAYIK